MRSWRGPTVGGQDADRVGMMQRGLAGQGVFLQGAVGSLNGPSATRALGAANRKQVAGGESEVQGFLEGMGELGRDLGIGGLVGEQGGDTIVEGTGDRSAVEDAANGGGAAADPLGDLAAAEAGHSLGGQERFEA